MNTTGIIIIIIFLLLLFICTIIIKKVVSSSENIEKLKKINENYCFKQYDLKVFIIKHRTKSLSALRKLSFDDVVLYNIENNIKLLRDNIEKMILNKQKYKEYLNEYNNFKNEIELNSDKSIFSKIEKIAIQFTKISNRFDIIVKMKLYYKSPKGRNYYQKKKKLKGKDLIEYYNIWKKKKGYQISAKFERSKMSDSIRYDVLKRDNFSCKICGATSREGAKLHVDHIIPVSKGGKTEMNNLQTLCERCNLGKSNK